MSSQIESNFVHKIDTKWNLWFHAIDNQDWTINGYKNIFCVDSFEKLFYLHEEISNITSGMFYFMKNNIEPLYESPENKNGMVISIKIPKNNANHLWKKITLAMINKTIVKNHEDMQYLNGLSISPKMYNCILKIWINTSSFVDISKYNFENFDEIKPELIIIKKN
jgi:hypothetical protein